MRSLVVLLFFPLLFLPAIAQDNALDGNTLRRYCAPYQNDTLGSDLDGAMHSSFCIGYVRGTIDTMSIWKAVDQRRKNKSDTVPHPCVPPTVSNEQIVKMVLKFLDDNPDQLHMPADALIFQSLQKGFPCKG